MLLTESDIHSYLLCLKKWDLMNPSSALSKLVLQGLGSPLSLMADLDLLSNPLEASDKAALSHLTFFF